MKNESQQDRREPQATKGAEGFISTDPLAPTSKLAQGGPGSNMHKHEGCSTFYSSWRKGVHGPPCADFKVEGLHLINATELPGGFINTTS